MGQAVIGWWQAAISERDPGEGKEDGGCADVLLLCWMGGCCYRAKSLQAEMEDGRRMLVGEEEGCVMGQADALRERERESRRGATQEEEAGRGMASSRDSTSAGAGDGTAKGTCDQGWMVASSMMIEAVLARKSPVKLLVYAAQ